jgi:hypothetical protein
MGKAEQHKKEPSRSPANSMQKAMQKKLTDSSVTSAVWMQVKALQRENVKIRLVKSNTAS